MVQALGQSGWTSGTQMVPAMPHTPGILGSGVLAQVRSRKLGYPMSSLFHSPRISAQEAWVRRFELGVGSVWAAIWTCGEKNAHVVLDWGELLPLGVFAFALQPDPGEDLLIGGRRRSKPGAPGPRCFLEEVQCPVDPAAPCAACRSASGAVG